MIFRIIFGIFSLFLFFLVSIFFVQIFLLIIAILLLPYQFLIILPVAIIYDTVFSGGGFPFFSVFVFALLIFLYFIKPYIRR